MPLFDVDQLVAELSNLGFRCRAGDFDTDVEASKRPYFERWLSNRDGFVKFLAGSLDYIGFEDVVRMGPFFNVYCLIQNNFIMDEDENAHGLLDASPCYQLYNGKIKSLNWSGGVIADILTKDQKLRGELADNIAREEVRKISVRAANFSCLIETRTWDVPGLVSVFQIVDVIALNVRQLLKQIHLGEDIAA